MAPHGVSPKKDELGALLEEFQRSRQSLKKFCFSREPLKPINNRRKILNPDNSNYEETMFYLKQLYKPDFEQRFQGTVSMANNFLKEMNFDDKITLGKKERPKREWLWKIKGKKDKEEEQQNEKEKEEEQQQEQQTQEGQED